jgi:hypothetical protein
LLQALPYIGTPVKGHPQVSADSPFSALYLLSSGRESGNH